MEINNLVFYEVNPHYFKDESGNGVGDLKGFVKKIDYFDFMNIDAIIFQGLLATDADQTSQSFMQIAKDLGDINDMKKIISSLKKTNKKVVIELNIGSIRASHNWFKSASESGNKEFSKMIHFPKDDPQSDLNVTHEYDPKTRSYYVMDNNTKEFSLNWNSQKVMKEFVEIIKFWQNIGINGFVLKNFEYLTDQNKVEIMSEKTLREMRIFYRAIKEIDDTIIVLGKSSIVPIVDCKKYTDGVTKIFDYFISTKFSLLGTSNQDNDKIGHFRARDLVNAITHFSSNSSTVVSFGSELSGRINSRWGDEGEFARESAKALALLLFFQPGSSLIYYGEELGSLNIGLNHLDDFQDETLNSRKRKKQEKGEKIKSFMDAQVLQNPLNSHSLMAWDDSKNGGFSRSNKTNSPVSTSYKEINVSNQFSSDSSVLNFYKKIIDFLKNTKFHELVRMGKFNIKVTLTGVIRSTLRHNGDELKLFVNLTDRVKSFKAFKESKVLLSTYFHKTYSENPTKLEPYEGILVSKYFGHEDSIGGSKQKDISDLESEKQMRHAEREIVKELKKGEDHFDLLEEDVLESERTTLTEEEIASTTQIDPNEMDDFLKSTKTKAD